MPYSSKPVESKKPPQAGDLFSKALRSIKAHPVAIGLSLIFALYFITRLAGLKGVPYFCDEGVYIRWAQQALFEHRWLGCLIDGKPPLHIWAIMPFLKIFDDPLVAGRVSSVFAGAFTTAGIFLLGRELKDSRFGLLSAFFYVICPYALWKDRLALAESLLLTFTVFAVFFTVKAVKSENYLYLAGTGVSTYLALMTKGTAFYLFLILPFAYVLSSPSNREETRAHPLLRWAVAIGVCLVAAYGAYSLLRIKLDFGLLVDVSSTRTLTFSRIITDPFAFFPGNADSILRNSFNLMTPVLFITCFAGLLAGLIRKWRPAILLALWFLVVWLVVGVTSLHPYPRFYLGMLPPLLLGASYAVTELAGRAREHGRKNEDRAAVLIAACVIVLLAAITVPAGIKTARVITNPAGAGLPDMIKSQYIDNWSAGWGLDQTVKYLERRAVKQKITVAADDGFFPGFALATYFFDNPNIDYSVYNKDAGLPPELLLAAKERPTYLVLNDYTVLPDDLPAALVKKFKKPEGKYLFLVRLRSDSR